jgi:hypothetical protein
VYARVAKWEGADADALEESAKEMASRADEGPPPGVPGVGFLMLIDPDSGRSLAIGLFETEEDMRKGDAVLNDMSPDRDDVGKRTSVEMYEVAVDVRI